jgi:hemerythrin-like domain-containing protein
MEKVIGNLAQKDQVFAELKELSSFFDTEFWVHFTKEEEALFPEIEKFMPRESGPLGVMLEEHVDLRSINARAQKAIRDYLGNSGDSETQGLIERNCSYFISLLRDHIFKEDSILFEMADEHLDQTQIDEIILKFHQIDASEVECET